MSPTPEQQMLDTTLADLEALRTFTATVFFQTVDTEGLAVAVAEHGVRLLAIDNLSRILLTGQEAIHDMAKLKEWALNTLPAVVKMWREVQ
jgi:hypothetical protein